MDHFFKKLFKKNYVYAQNENLKKLWKVLTIYISNHDVTKAYWNRNHKEKMKTTFLKLFIHSRIPVIGYKKSLILSKIPIIGKNERKYL